jgi:CheY-like chemotaxis protein
MPPNILVVDDHESMRRRIRSLLGSAGIGICAEAATSPTSPPPVPERTATWYAVILP